MLEAYTKENRNLYLVIDGKRQWCRKLSFAVRIGKRARQLGAYVRIVETVWLWSGRPGKPMEQIDFSEYDRSKLLNY